MKRFILIFTLIFLGIGAAIGQDLQTTQDVDATIPYGDQYSYVSLQSLDDVTADGVWDWIARVKSQRKLDAYLYIKLSQESGSAEDIDVTLSHKVSAGEGWTTDTVTWAVSSVDTTITTSIGSYNFAEFFKAQVAEPSGDLQIGIDEFLLKFVKE